MSKRANPAVIGAFLLGAVALIIVGVVVFGSGKFFGQKRDFVAYFDVSIKGLDVGAPVKVRGVTVGTVKEIELQYNPTDYNVVIPVFFSIDFDKIHYVGVERESWMTLMGMDVQERVDKLIKHGFRAQLQLQSFVTGKLFVSLDFLPDTPVQLVGRAPAGVYEVPTIPSPLDELTKSLEKLPLKELADEAVSAMHGIAELVNSPKVKDIIDKLDATVEDINKLVNDIDAEVKPLARSTADTLAEARSTLKDAQQLLLNVDTQVAPVAENVQQTLTEARATLAGAQKTLSEVDAMIAADAPLQYRIAETLDEIERAARSIRTLTDYIDQHPEALLHGKEEAGGQ
ncbi:MAG: MlaD family protein [Gammaproteobacteria bacterium]|nr:MlaD family protein [Gammaproteobacteria bacterium]